MNGDNETNNEGNLLKKTFECLYMDEYIDRIERLHESIQRASLENESLKIIDRVDKEFPSFVKNEKLYQAYRNKFSKAYFSGDPMYVGSCWTDWYISRPFRKEEFVLLVMFSLLINLNKSNNTYYV